MLKRFVYLSVNLLILTAGNVGAETQSERITDFKSIWNNCDYLIITPLIFMPAALRLSAHRNQFAGDDVEQARVAVLEDILSSFASHSDTVPRHEVLWGALKYAYEQWYRPLDYVILLGDDSIGWNASTEKPVSLGIMPSFINGSYVSYHSARYDTLFEYADEFYTVLRKSTLPGLYPEEQKSRVVIGRIPGERLQQIHDYVDKVIAFDTAAVELRGWRGGALIMADDARQKDVPDPLHYLHFSAAEQTGESRPFSSMFLSKIYLSDYQRDMSGNHVAANLTFHQEMVSSGLWTVYFGHGSQSWMSDEAFLGWVDGSRMANTGKPTVMCAFACLNGAYHRRVQPAMAKQMLFKAQGGALAYIASSNLEYAGPNENFARKFFAYVDSVPHLSIGKLLWLTKKSCTYENLSYYHLLGDPALRITGSRPAHWNMKIQNLEGSPSRVVVEIQNGQNDEWYYQYRISRRDSARLYEDSSRVYMRDVFLTEGGGISRSLLSIPLPARESGRIRVTLYAWNNSFEFKADTILELEKTSIASVHKFSSLLNNGIKIRFGRSTLVVRGLAVPLGEAFEVRVLRLDGKVIARKIIDRKEEMVVFKELYPGTGKYILTVRGRNGQYLAAKQFCIGIP